MTNNKEQKFILVLFILSLVVRLLIAPIYVDPPEIPHDFEHYIDYAKTKVNGTIFEVNYLSESGPSPYGPLFAIFLGTWTEIFGYDYTLMKYPFMLLDVFSIILVYYIVKNLSTPDAAKYASILYAFSYVAISSSALEGNDDFLYLFFSLAAIFCLIKSKPNLNLSAIFIGAAMSIKLLPFVYFFLPIQYYLYQKNGVKTVLRYALTSILTVLVVYIPFYKSAGLNVLNTFTSPQTFYLSGQSLLAGLNILLNFLTLEDWTKTLIVENPIATKLALPFMLFGFAFAVAYIIKFKIENKEVELIRNSFIFIVISFVFGRYMSESIFIGIVPVVVILFAQKYQDPFKISKTEILGIILIIISILIYAYIYRWRVDYSSLDRYMLMIGLILSFIGTYAALIKSDFKYSWSFAVLSFAFYRTVHADLLLLLGNVIPLFQDYRIAWGAWTFGEPIIFIFSMTLLLKKIHEKTV